MGCDHLICKICKVGFDIENGTAFWIGDFLKCHWHTLPKLKGSYFEVAFADFPKHLTVRHRVPAGYISVREKGTCFRNGRNNCFHRKCLLRNIKWINKQKKIGKWKKAGYTEDPFILSKRNKMHDHIIA